jgi:hypothetical protein
MNFSKLVTFSLISNTTFTIIYHDGHLIITVDYKNDIDG